MFSVYDHKIITINERKQVIKELLLLFHYIFAMLIIIMVVELRVTVSVCNDDENDIIFFMGKKYSPFFYRPFARSPNISLHRCLKSLTRSRSQMRTMGSKCQNSFLSGLLSRRAVINRV